MWSGILRTVGVLGWMVAVVGCAGTQGRVETVGPTDVVEQMKPSVAAIAVDKDERRLYTYSNDHHLRVFAADPRYFNVTHQLDKMLGFPRTRESEMALLSDRVLGDGILSCAAMSADGARLATGDYFLNDEGTEGSRVRIWDLSAGKVLVEFDLKEGIMAGHIAFSSDGRFVGVSFFTAHVDVPNHWQEAAVRIWDLRTLKEVALTGLEAEAGETGSPSALDMDAPAIAFAPGEAALLTPNGWIDVEKGKWVRYPGKVFGKYAVDVTCGRELLALRSKWNRLAVYRRTDGSQVWGAEDAAFGDAEGMEFSPDGALLLVSGLESTVVMDAKTGKMLGMLSHGRDPAHFTQWVSELGTTELQLWPVYFMRDGKSIWGGEVNNGVGRWDVSRWLAGKK